MTQTPVSILITLGFEQILTRNKIKRDNPASFIYSYNKQLFSELSMKVPVLLIVVEGDISTIHQVKTVLEKSIPVLLIKGSGKAADFIAEYLVSR